MSKTPPIEDSYILTGYEASCLPILKNRISNMARHCKYFYVGLTNRPQRRFYEHRTEDGILWDRMIVLYSTKMALREGNFEEALITYYKSSKYAKKLKNRKDGRQGPCCDPPYYIYVILKY